MTSVQVALCYALEKANRSTVGLGHAERERAQDNYLRGALAEPNRHEPLIALALVYCLWCMDDATHDYLMGAGTTRSKRIEVFLGELQKSPPDVIQAAVLALISVEVERVAARHSIGFNVDLEKHEAKNFRFIIELDALLQNIKLHLASSFEDPRSAGNVLISSNFEACQQNTAQIVNESGIILLRIENSSVYWAAFQRVLKKCTGTTPAPLMTETLRLLHIFQKNAEPLCAWQKVLKQHCDNRFLPETNKTSARVELKKCEKGLSDNQNDSAISITSYPGNFSSIMHSDGWRVMNNKSPSVSSEDGMEGRQSVFTIDLNSEA